MEKIETMKKMLSSSCVVEMDEEKNEKSIEALDDILEYEKEQDCWFDSP